jgi:hypothetical protein
VGFRERDQDLGQARPEIEGFFPRITRINTNGLIKGKSLSWERSAVGSENRDRRVFPTNYTNYGPATAGMLIRGLKKKVPPLPQYTPQPPVSQSLAKHSQLTTNNSQLRRSRPVAGGCQTAAIKRSLMFNFSTNYTNYGASYRWLVYPWTKKESPTTTSRNTATTCVSITCEALTTHNWQLTTAAKPPCSRRSPNRRNQAQLDVFGKSHHYLNIHRNHQCLNHLRSTHNSQLATHNCGEAASFHRPSFICQLPVPRAHIYL